MAENSKFGDTQRPPFAWDSELASERLFDLAVERYGGHRTNAITAIVAGFENADWVFEDQRIIVEHKAIETEVTRTSKFQSEYERLITATPRAARSGYALGKAIQPFLAQIAKKANRQIRSTARRLNWEPHYGLLILSNRDFTSLPPGLIVSVLGDVLLRHYSEITAFIYITDHYVDVPGSDLANILWSPQYHPDAPSFLQAFVNGFGTEFFKVLEEQFGPFDEHLTGDNPAWLEFARPIVQWRR